MHIYCTHQGQVTCTIQTPKDSNVKGIVKLFLTSGTSSHYDAIGPIKHNTSTKDFISPCTPVVINDDQDLTTDPPAITSSSPMILVQNTTDKSLTSVQSSPIPPVVLSPESILPFPKAGKLVNARRRNRRKSAILTDTPVKKMLEEEQEKSKRKRDLAKSRQNSASKITEEQQKRQKRKHNTAKSGKQKPVKHVQKKLCYQSNDESCLICNEPYSNSRAGEHWIQCVECKNWGHEECVLVGKSNTFICHNCKADNSDYCY